MGDFQLRIGNCGLKGDGKLRERALDTFLESAEKLREESVFVA